MPPIPKLSYSIRNHEGRGLKASGEQCLPGDTGHVVATSLYNYAMPVIRYRFKDLVTVGGPCSCGRNLPVISKILGREKGLFRLADGCLMLPEFRTERFKQLADTAYWQVAQVSPSGVEVRLRNARISNSVVDAVRDYVCSVIGARVDVLIRTINKFPRTQGGKFYPIVREFD